MSFPRKKRKLPPPGWPLLANENDPFTLRFWPWPIFSYVPRRLAQARSFPSLPDAAGFKDPARQSVRDRLDRQISSDAMNMQNLVRIRGR